MNDEDLKRFEVLCQAIYGENIEARKNAEQQLAMFEKIESVPKLKLIFDRSSNPNAIFFSSAQLLKLFSNHWNSFNKEQKAEIRNYLLNYMGKGGFNLPDYVANTIYRLLGRMTKMGWLEEQSNRDLPDQIKKYFVQSTDPNVCIVGLQILRSIIEEMNTLAQRKSLTQHRKTAVSFRDLALRGIFEAALFTLKELARNPNVIAQKPRLCSDALGVVLASLKFDFVGIFPDESTEDVGTIQIPSGWRPLFEESDTLQLFWNLYGMTPGIPKAQSQVLKVLVLLSSVRRSLFTGDDERKAYLSLFVDGIVSVLTTKQGLNVSDNYHQFCRLLARLKSNFQLNEFIACTNYNKWLEMVATFSIESFKSWQYSGQSVYYILNLWSRLVASKPYLKSDTDSFLERFVPEITKQFIISRLEFARGCALDSAIENPLEHKENLDEQLDALPQLVHSDYEKTGVVFTTCFDPIFQMYTDCIRRNDRSKFNELEHQLTWLIFMFGAVIGKRFVSATTGTTDDSEIIDGNLTARVMQCITVINDRLRLYSDAVQDEGLQHLENAVLYFMKHFKRVYLGDAMVTHSKIYTRMKELMNLSDQLQILNVFITKIGTNLKVWAESEIIIKQTISLFDDIATGYSSAKLAAKLDSTKFLLTKHTTDNFPFLQVSDNIRQRTTFYHTLCKLLFLQNYTEDDFLDFMKPLEHACLQLESISSFEQFRTDPVRFALIGWLRDMRGICMGCSSKKTYQYLFEWMYPNHMPLLLKAVQVWFDQPTVMIALLKFVNEFSLNRNSRITFGPSSPNGILLFKEISVLLVTYGKQIANLPVYREHYAERYKGISVCMKILSSALNGNYCNFGVFALYNDRSLIDCLDIIIRLSLAIPLSDILAYPKLTKSYFGLVETLFHNHIEQVIEFESQIFLKLVASLEEGVRLEDLSLSSQICASLDHLCTFYYTQAKKATKQAMTLQEHLKQNIELFPRLLQQFFQLIIYEECGNQWSVSRTMLSLIVINPPMFEEIKKRVIFKVGQNDEQRRLKMIEAFDKLMEGVEMNLEAKTRDKFTGNLITFRQDVRAIL